ncbi:hypothetical protein GCM10010302_72870 [Streptomyces polychromogenes]|uniref:Uncharacterized protein n=1 Tax=Streptomyces polychromogenes TaxID=67342 RepID=A0ABP3FRX3_9ACTN
MAHPPGVGHDGNLLDSEKRRFFGARVPRLRLLDGMADGDAHLSQVVTTPTPGSGPPSEAQTWARSHPIRRVITAVDGIEAKEWTPRELPHSFVSLLSDEEARSKGSRGSSGTLARRSGRRSTGSSSTR